MSDMEDKTKVESVPYVVHEGAMARQERTIKRLWILCLVMFLALVGTNAGWIYYESQFQVSETTVTQDNADGVNNYIGNDGDIYNGETNDKNTQEGS